jgi:hypothetical protein
MPAYALLKPDNRLLTWSTQDVSLYGVQPTAGVVVARADPSLSETDALGAAHGATATSHGADNIQPAAFLTPQSGNEHVGGAPHTSPTVDIGHSFAPLADSAASSSETGAPQIGISHGSGPPGAGFFGSDHAAASPSSPNGQSSADHAPIAAAFAGALADGDGGIGASLSAAMDAVSHAPLDAVGQLAADLTSPTPVDTLIAPASDTLHDIAGIDPAAGISTLVSMVQSDNLFDLRDATAPDVFGQSNSIVDTLSTDIAEAAPALLGDNDHHDSVLPVIDHHGDGLLGGL